MAFDKRRQSQFPKRKQVLARNRGLSGSKGSLSGVKSALRRLEAAQTEREAVRGKQKPKKTEPGTGGPRFRMLVLLAAVVYGIWYFSEHLDDFLEAFGDIESLVSGNGDELVDKLMEKLSATATRESTSPTPDNRHQPVRREEPKPPAPRALPMGGPVSQVSEFPRYAGSEVVFEDETVGVYATTDSVPRVADITLKLLEEAGWHGTMTAENEEMRHLTFTRGHQKVTAYISIAPGLGNRTSIQYHIVKR